MKQLSNTVVQKCAVSLIALSVATGGLQAIAQDESGDTVESEEAVSVDSDQAEDGSSARTLGVVYVNARKREEREIDAPVAMAAVPAVEIDQRGLNDLSQLSTVVPELRISENTIAYGGNLTLRGVSSATSTASVDQAVTVNVDGIPISYAGVVKLGQFDLGQVEVLKGPQALFFGKNSTGGIVSLASAAPTEEFDYRIRGEYETESQRYGIESYVSGPLAEGVLGRLAVRYTDADGWLDNVVPTVPGAVPPRDDKGPEQEQFLAKGSLFIDPSADFSLKLRGGYSDLDAGSGYMITQRIHCPYGQAQGPFALPDQNCVADNVTTQPYNPPGLDAFDGRFNADGSPYLRVKQHYLVADVSYDITDSISLTSITGLYSINLDASDNVSSGAIPFIEYASSVEKTSYSQEFRLANDPDSRLTWVAGVFLQDDEFVESQSTVIGVLTPSADFELTGTTISPFVQLGLDITDKLNISAGVRYSDETKQQKIGHGEFEGQYRKEVNFYNLSPEITASYAINPNANVYVAYKEAYKSGGFQTEHVAIPATLAAGASIDNSFEEELVSGFEVGSKMYLFDQSLRLAGAAYHFEYEDLQLGRFDPVVVATVLDNVGAATIEGVEVDFEYRPADIDGLRINGAFAYTDATYDEYLAACYNGQTAAAGCDPVLNLQDQAGKRLPRAPEWSATLGGAYEGTLTSSLDYRINAGVQYNTEYESMSEAIPHSQQESVFTVDAGLAFMDSSRIWEFAVIGRNLTDENTLASGLQVPATGNATTFSDLAASVNPGRQVMFRLTYHP
ncbi:TonB-dependent receptor [Henriciella sp. AS95]|uniref:TonB-dependent receptor n=1 Tax=Henriciella sp. AS95 TaxID=3135782 RepID=UPI00316EE0B9